MSMWEAFRPTNNRDVRGDVRACKYWVTYCIACEAAYAKYLEAVCEERPTLGEPSTYSRWVSATCVSQKGDGVRKRGWES